MKQLSQYYVTQVKTHISLASANSSQSKKDWILTVIKLINL